MLNETVGWFLLILDRFDIEFCFRFYLLRTKISLEKYFWYLVFSNIFFALDALVQSHEIKQRKEMRDTGMITEVNIKKMRTRKKDHVFFFFIFLSVAMAIRL